MARDEVPLPGEPLNSPLPEADVRLLGQLREGDIEAGRRFVRDYYSGVYRYLLYLTGHRETAEDLTQETFFQVWRHLDQFQGCAPLRLWLHAIARREFLQARRRQRDVTSLDEAVELPEPRAGMWTDEAELRVLLGKLPEEQREVMVLHYLGGYSSTEIAQIVQAPARTVRYRLGAGRAHLAQALGPGDLAYLNEPAVPMRQWAWLPLDRMHALEARLAIDGTGAREARKEEAMERREFLRQAAVGAAGLMLPEAEQEVVDSRLTQKVTLAFKGTAQADVCEHLRAETAVYLAAGPSVADEKVTLFCEKLPLREVMRQLSRPFGYTWLRSGKTGEFKYELAQDLKSQLLEEELRNRDRNAALLSLEREIDRFRPYLPLSPDEALARAKTAPAAEKSLLEQLAGVGWGPIQMYFRLSPPQLAALRAGQTLIFNEEPKAGQYPLPKDMDRGVLQCNRTWQVVKSDDGGLHASVSGEDPQSVPLTACPEVRALMYLTLSRTELGQFALSGASGFMAGSSVVFEGSGPFALGRDPGGSAPEGGSVNPKLAGDPTLRQRVSIQPQPSCSLPPRPSHGSERVSEQRGEVVQPKVTTADVMEAIHHATRLPIVADFYTRLYKPEAVSGKDQPLFETLNQLTQAMRLRWNKEGGSRETDAWLQFRSVTYYHDRLKEVPNRLLSRWAQERGDAGGRRQEAGGLTLDQIVEIAQLTDDQLDGAEMAKGAIECWGLKEWRLLGDGPLRSHVRYLGEFTPAQRQEMMSAAGLPFPKMSLTQQQGFLARAFQTGVWKEDPPQSLDELAGATLRVDYTQPGWYQWLQPGDLSPRRWVVALGSGPNGRRVLMPPVRERTPEAVLQAARRMFPPVTDEKLLPRPEQIAPTELDLVIVYIPGTSTARPIRWFRVNQQLAGIG